MTIIHY